MLACAKGFSKSGPKVKMAQTGWRKRLCSKGRKAIRGLCNLCNILISLSHKWIAKNTLTYRLLLNVWDPQNSHASMFQGALSPIRTIVSFYSVCFYSELRFNFYEYFYRCCFVCFQACRFLYVWTLWVERTKVEMFFREHSNAVLNFMVFVGFSFLFF